jgi:hypothetical protein
MNRRGVLGILGIGAAAGPALISQSVEATPAILGSQGITSGFFSGKDNMTEAIAWNPVEQLADARREYALLTGDREKWVADWFTREWEEYQNGYSSYRIENIDADIRNMKSFSETAKVRMHIMRRAERRADSYTRNTFERIQQLLKAV